MAFEEEFEVNKKAQIKEIANAKKIQQHMAYVYMYSTV